jgi:hypothetical protein
MESVANQSKGFKFIRCRLKDGVEVAQLSRLEVGLDLRMTSRLLETLQLEGDVSNSDPSPHAPSTDTDVNMRFISAPLSLRSTSQ